RRSTARSAARPDPPPPSRSPGPRGEPRLTRDNRVAPPNVTLKTTTLRRGAPIPSTPGRAPPGRSRRECRGRGSAPTELPRAEDRSREDQHSDHVEEPVGEGVEEPHHAHRRPVHDEAARVEEIQVRKHPVGGFHHRPDSGSALRGEIAEVL